MTDQQFWDVIDAADSDIDELVDILSDLPAEMIVAFENHVRRRFMASYREELWGAAYLMLGGCTDETFDSFRCWLIGRGQEVYDAALKDPDSLATLGRLDNEPEWQPLLSAADEAYEIKTDKPIEGAPSLEAVAFPNMGSSIDFDDEKTMRKRYPRLFAVHIDG
jgi:hypothetical protein